MTTTDEPLPVADPVALTARAAIYRHEPAPTPGERFTVTVTSRLSIAIHPRAAYVDARPVASDDRALCIEWRDGAGVPQGAVIPLGPAMVRALRGALDAADRDAEQRGGQPPPGGQLMAVDLGDDSDDDF